MKNRAIFLAFLALAAATVALGACGSDSGTANLEDATLARGFDSGRAVDPTSIFATADKVHLVIKMNNAPTGTSVKAVWSMVAVSGYEPMVLDESPYTLKKGENVAHFILTNDQPWPVGGYRVEVYLNGKLSRTLEYQVEETEAKTPTIVSATLARGYDDPNPVDPTNVFTPDDVMIHLIVKVGNAVEGVSLRATWYLAESQSYKPEIIDNATYVLGAGGNAADFTLTNDKPWPVGKYRVQIYLGNTLVQTLEYEVQ